MTDQEKQLFIEAEMAAHKSDNAFTKFQRAVYTLLLVTFFGVGATLIIWVMEPAPTADYRRELLTKEVYPGGEVKIKVTVTWTKTCYSRLNRRIVFSNGIPVPYEPEVRLNKLGLQEFTIAQKLPEDAPPGPAQWIVVTEWFCNPVQYFLPNTVSLPPLDFMVLPKGNSDEDQL